MMIKDIEINDFDYPLPDGLIARHPLADRDKCRLLCFRPGQPIDDRRFDDLPGLLPSDAMLVYNNTRVINARLRFRKGENHDGALIEVFCLEPVEPADYALSFAATEATSWRCFVGNSKRWKDGLLSMDLRLDDGTALTLNAERVSRDDNSSVVRFSWSSDRQGRSVSFSEIIEMAGEIPIPPYLNRSTEQSDSTDYQTVFSHIEGSVAAPTAGLHFTNHLLREIDRRGILRRELTLHVGAGTFQPVKSDRIGDHAMHSEFISVPVALIRELADTERPVFAVGTTSVRTLESLYHLASMAAETGVIPAELPQWRPYDPEACFPDRKTALSALLRLMKEDGMDRLVASTRLMIAPGYTFRIVDGIITNFHQPKSTLLLLVSAFTGGDWRRIYDHALVSGYRFLSYGDANLLMR
ncbi:MAG: S-adenosylmethionine:tRNA ribosyltransferase-isomerase [Clostridium sp.]|nr:S-adenosylmethionine:tRNA ribosyltransferase-isomerase [Clostridium sp.]